MNIICTIFFYRFSKVKRWSKTYEKLPDDPTDSKWPAQKYNKNVNFIPSSESIVENEKSNSACKLKYQQATIDVSSIHIAYRIILCEGHYLVFSIKK